MSSLKPTRIVTVKSLEKTFKLPHEQSSGIKQLLVNKFKGKKGYEIQHVLKNINFEINKGEFFGIVGRNGSGKSTLLKLLAGIYVPDSGTVQVDGSLTPFIELGVGFNPELTGRENVFLNGALLGFSKQEMNHMYDDIVQFAELEKFMDQKLKNYSSGMQVRLAFSIAIRAKSDILLIDEVLAVGDAAFQQKCFDYFDKVKKEQKTIIFVSHDMSTVRKYCDRALYISKGRITKVGKSKDIAEIYDRDNNEQIAIHTNIERNANNEELLVIETFNQNQAAQNLFEYGDKILISLSWNSKLLQKPVQSVGVAIFKGDQNVYGVNTIGKEIKFKNRILLSVDLNLGPGKYKIVAGLFGTSREDSINFNANGPEFVINRVHTTSDSEDWEGITKLDSEWMAKNDK